MQILLLGATGRTGHLVLSEALRRGHTITALVRRPSALDPFLSTLPADQRARLRLTTGSALHPPDVAAALSTFTSPTTTTISGRDVNNNDNNNNTLNTLVVISTLNARRTSDNPFAAPHPTDSPPRMMADSIANILSALRQQQQQQPPPQQPPQQPPSSSRTTTANTTATTTKPTTTPRPKIIVLSALGAGSSAANTHPAIRALIALTNMRLQYADHAAVERELTLHHHHHYHHLRGDGDGDGDDDDDDDDDNRDVADFVLVRPTRLVEGPGEGDGDGDEVARVFDVVGRGSAGRGGARVVPMMATVSRRAVARFLVDAAESQRWDGMAPILVG